MDDENVTEASNDKQNSASTVHFIHEENEKILNGFVSEAEVAASLARKEATDSVSLDGSYVSGGAGSLSELSTCSAFSLTALNARKQQLYESIRSQLGSTYDEDPLQTPDNSMVMNSDVVTSTPFQNTETPAAKFLKDWRSSFPNNVEDTQVVDQVGPEEPLDRSENNSKYEEAFSSLKSILSGTSEDILDAYENTLVAYKQENDKKFEEMLSYLEKEPFGEDFTSLDDLDDTIKEDTVIPININDTTIVNEPANDIIKLASVIDELEREAADIQRNWTKEPVVEIEAQESKDPENLIIAGEEEAAAVDITPVDEDRLLASDDEAELIQQNAPLQPVPIEDKPWVSNDEEENRDNNDPQWELLKNLGSDYERYLAVRNRWQNIVVPNPKKDLTCRCPRPEAVVMVNGTVGTNNPCANNPVSGQTVNEGLKRAASPVNYNWNNKRFKQESCTMLYDRSIEMLIRDTEQQKQRFELEEEHALNRLAECQKLDQYHARQQRRTPLEWKLMNDKHHRETIDCVQSFAARRNYLTEMTHQKIKALRLAAAEVREFHEFYPADPNAELSEKGDKNSLIYLSEVEVQEILETESMLIRFESFYKVPTT